WYDPIALDAPCLQCGRQSHFKSDKGSNLPPLREQKPLRGLTMSPPEPNWLAHGEFVRTFHCSRDATHRMWFWFHLGRHVLQKIGQFPSLADLSASELRAHKKVLGEPRLREMYRAVGLAAHGVGIGAFVYL